MSLPAVDGVDLNEVARVYAAAVPRVLAELRVRFALADLAIVVLLIYLSRVAVRLIESVPASSPSWAVLVATTAYGLVIIAGGVLVRLLAGSLRADPLAVDLTAVRPGPRLITFLTERVFHSWLLLTVVITGLVTPVDELEALWFDLGFDSFRRAAGFSSNLVTLFATLALGELYFLMCRYALREKRAGRPRPLDRVGTRLVVVAAGVRRCAEHEVADREVRSLVSALERTAREAERFPLLSVPWPDRAGRRAAGADGARLAAAIRAHKAPLLRAIGAADFTMIARSLTGGAAAWARDDLATMVRDTPEVVVPRGVRPWLARLGPALLLAALGVVLPLLPPLNEVAQAAAATRASLVAGALMAVVTGGIQAPEYVKTVLEKTVLSK